MHDQIMNLWNIIMNNEHVKQDMDVTWWQKVGLNIAKKGKVEKMETYDEKREISRKKQEKRGKNRQKVKNKEKWV